MPTLNITHGELASGIEVLVNGKKPVYHVLGRETNTKLYDTSDRIIPIDPTAVYNPVGVVRPARAKQNIVYAVYLKDQNLGFFTEDVAAPSPFEEIKGAAYVLHLGDQYYVAVGMAPFFPPRNYSKEIFEALKIWNLDDRIEIASTLFRIGSEYTPKKVYSESEAKELSEERQAKFESLLSFIIRRTTGKIPKGFQPIIAPIPTNIESEGYDLVSSSLVAWLGTLLESISQGRRDNPALIHKLLLQICPQSEDHYKLPENALLVPVNLVRYEKNILEKRAAE